MGEKISVISSYDFVKHEVNYGSLFQYYALEKFLMNRGHYVEWIRYVHKKKIAKKIYEEFNKVFRDSYIENKCCLSKVRCFIREKLNVTEDEYYSEEQIKSACKDSTVFITGSDQVWGGPIRENFLTFARDDQLKISYAASFGKRNIEISMANTIAPWIKKMDYISLREESGVDICSQLGRDDTVVVPDPTILLEKKDYPVTNPQIKHNYIFGYFLNIQDESSIPYSSIKSYLEEASDRMRFISCVTSGTKKVPLLLKENRVYPSPSEWIGYYKNTKVILTNSFHGTVFALIFQKPFVVFLQNGTTAEQNERIFNLLGKFDLLDRIYEEGYEINEIVNKPIDWNKISRIMEDQRDIAINFLKKAHL